MDVHCNCVLFTPLGGRLLWTTPHINHFKSNKSAKHRHVFVLIDKNVDDLMTAPELKMRMSFDFMCGSWHCSLWINHRQVVQNIFGQLFSNEDEVVDVQREQCGWCLVTAVTRGGSGAIPTPGHTSPPPLFKLHFPITHSYTFTFAPSLCSYTFKLFIGIFQYQKDTPSRWVSTHIGPPSI